MRTPVTLLSASAAVLTAYGYLFGQWADLHDQRFGLLDVTREWIARPLGLGEDFGPLGLMLLLVAAGYAAAAGRALGELYPLAALVVIAHLLPPTAGLVPLGWVAVLALIGFLLARGTALLPARYRWTGQLAQLVLALNAVALADFVPDLSAAAAFFPLFVAGQLLHTNRAGLLPAWACGLLIAAALAVVAIADRVVPELDGWWYPLAATYAMLLGAVAFLLAGPTADRIAANPVVRWLAERVWWLIPLYAAVGHPLADLLPHPAGILVAVAGVGLLAEGCHRASRLLTQRTKEAV
ncbi:hypothetical protein [Amycolatopsis sp. YIM 10]|uniref:hypothetical protein n=1 Tax=Amycolatopsis sp. YIM 10 TaxID=2653857 RepID=UPI00128FE6C6|nr:hypothetical protein [Amycolatopsis sp. YIM 10]QFU85355.1 hypothetical protein YIM_00605 [Amycolatopsis sp. YIM 10]